MVVRQQTATELFTSGDSVPLAELRQELSELAARYGEPVREGSDELGTYGFLVVPLGKGKNAFLYQYRDAPEMGTLIRVDAHANKAKMWLKLRRMLDLGEDDYLWLAPDVQVARADPRS
jgi:hypothetical protein